MSDIAWGLPADAVSDRIVISTPMRPFVRALMSRPGEWAKFPVGVKYSSARSVLSNGAFFGIHFRCKKVKGEGYACMAEREEWSR